MRMPWQRAEPRARPAGIEEGKAAGIEEGKAVGIEEGKAAGIEEGKAAGIAEERSQIALAMLKEGDPEAKICRITGLSRKELALLKRGMKLDK